MGKRKSRMSKLLAQPKKQPKLDTAFTCPFCGLPGSVECVVDLKHLIAEASCFVCNGTYSTNAHPLTEPVDVYSEWIDACERVNKEAGAVANRRRGDARLASDDDGDFLA